ncbi:aldo/keto reductase [Planomonospora corallina]|uniref:Aldo/keto reductase n=1 Tax=Planomonospora corallina TaxID=1806052 RepID=A0ABV8ICW5_9ACTN
MSRTVVVIGGGHGGSAACSAASCASSGRAAPPAAAAVLAGRREIIEAYEELCADLGEDPADVGLAWLLAQQGVTGPIIGPRTIEQLDGSLRALRITLDDSTPARLEELFPPPGLSGAGHAPEAYAW